MPASCSTGVTRSKQLAESSSYLEVTYLLLNGELPNKEQLDAWTAEIAANGDVPAALTGPFLQGFEKSAHPMGILESLVAALSTYYPESKQVEPTRCPNRHRQIVRLIAKVSTLAAAAHRHGQGLPAVAPNPELSSPPTS